jgi:hypothetical protein
MVSCKTAGHDDPSSNWSKTLRAVAANHSVAWRRDVFIDFRAARSAPTFPAIVMAQEPVGWLPASDTAVELAKTWLLQIIRFGKVNRLWLSFE